MMGGVESRSLRIVPFGTMEGRRGLGIGNGQRLQRVRAARDAERLLVQRPANGEEVPADASDEGGKKQPRVAVQFLFHDFPCVAAAWVPLLVFGFGLV